ncbi:ABC transporter substrate-binding protein [Mailhella massiliensis]|uniref:ABC transporter substrate-binding protein n=1 Tax=Mailhella massiliensis TaxID=1903261 RepID=A0A921AV57_9BACT|nr:ABC transporter substrate binding protein [Mailhella massiliensis]HJD96684.1 ABC transporter substrate-binding protein [Mailhella massiliensis]
MPETFRIFRSLLFVLFFLTLAGSGHAWAGEKVWRVLYVEGGPFSNYQQTLAHTARGLEKLGLIDNGQVAIPTGTESTSAMWLWLADHAKGRVKFLRDGHYSAEWDAVARKSIREAIIERVRERKDVDMIIAMGTWSGLDMSSEDLGIPVFSMSVTDAVSAGIVASAEDSGKDNVHAQLEPGRFRRQISMFHEIFHFKKLGVPFEDTPEGRNTAAMDEIEQTAKELGIELVLRSAPLDLPDPEAAFRNLMGCVTELSQEADALYLTYTSTPMDKIPELMVPVINAGIPSFAQAGPQLVEYGVLMSLAQASFADIGQFEAEAIAAVIQGKKPREVSQIFEPELGLAINLKTAMRIGWNPPLEILAAVDEIYQQIPAANHE